MVKLGALWWWQYLLGMLVVSGDLSGVGTWNRSCLSSRTPFVLSVYPECSEGFVILCCTLQTNTLINFSFVKMNNTVLKS